MSVALWLRRMASNQLGVLISLAVTLLALALFALVSLAERRSAIASFLEQVELRSLDSRFLLRGARQPDPRIVIVGIDENTLRRLGSFPVERKAYARLVEMLSAAGARVIAFDLTFPSSEKNSALEALDLLGKRAPRRLRRQIASLKRSSDNDALLAQAMARAGNVILGHIFLDPERARGTDAKQAEEYYNILWGQPFPLVQKVTSGRDFNLDQAWREHGQVAFGIEPNIRPLGEAAKSYGFLNINPDSDGVLRRATLLIRYQDLDYFPALAFQIVKAYEQIPDTAISAAVSENGLERLEFGSHRVTTERDGTALINYRGPYRTYPHYSMSEVLDGTMPADTFRDKMVLLGPTALGIGDMRITPFSSQQGSYMGVEVHANILDNLLHSEEQGRSFLRRGPQQELLDVFFIVLLGAGMGMVFTRAKPLYSTVALVAALAIFGLVVYTAFLHWGLWLSFVIPAGTLVANYAAITSYRMIFEEREKRRIRKTFSQFVAPGVIRLIEQDPAKYFRPGGELKELTIMFSDIRSFTAIAEGMQPDELVGLLNEYLGEMTDVLFRRWGTLDKYIGDAIMAFWGSPYPQADHAFCACACALEMRERLALLNQRWEQQGRKALQIGIGINTGFVKVGNMGSSRRLSWTVIGDDVNLSSRLEGLNKAYTTGIVVSEATYNQTREHFVFRPLDLIRVKGKLAPVGIYELLAFASEGHKYDDLLARFQNARQAYGQQAWDDAIAQFEDLLAHYPGDGPAQVMLRRCYEFRQHAPEAGWDGVYVMQSK